MLAGSFAATGGPLPTPVLLQPQPPCPSTETKLPSNGDEAALRRLAGQLRARQVVVKLFLRHPLHAKLYLLYRSDTITPTVGYLGSSNLTFAGLAQQGELNVDVVDRDATLKLEQWFKHRWDDNFCVDISDELAAIIDASWAGDKLTPPYHLYLKMAFHLSREAREGVSEFTIPANFANKLFDFQQKAVQIAARHLNRRGGVLIGDVVGLGKTLRSIAQNDKSFETDFHAYLAAFDAETRWLLGIEAVGGETFLDIGGVIDRLKAKKIFFSYAKERC